MTDLILIKKFHFLANLQYFSSVLDEKNIPYTITNDDAALYVSPADYDRAMQILADQDINDDPGLSDFPKDGRNFETLHSSDGVSVYNEIVDINYWKYMGPAALLMGFYIVFMLIEDAKFEFSLQAIYVSAALLIMLYFGIKLTLQLFRK
jgi:hypothetical protein